MPTRLAPHGRAERLLIAASIVAIALSGCSSPPEQPVPTPSPSGSSGTPPSQSPSGPTEQEQVALLASPGRYDVAETDYELPDLMVPGLSGPVEVVGHVVGPVGAAEALPVVVLLHGYWASCWSARESSTAWPCPRGQKPIGNHLGYRYLQERLASHGFLTVSVSANGVNVLATDMGDDAGAAARSVLVRHHLDELASGGIDALAQWPSIDLRSVLLMGHSRGGEGVDRAAFEQPAQAPWEISGVVLVGSTAFEPAPSSRTAVVAMSGDCDGDVGPSLGQLYVDRAAEPDAVRSSVLIRGANHNYFNTEWDEHISVSGGGYDDVVSEGGMVDPICEPTSPTRLDPDAQRETLARGMTVVASALLTDSDIADRVLQSVVPFPATAGGKVWVTPTGSGRRIFAPQESTDVAASPGASASLCRTVSETDDPRDCGRGGNQGVNPHWPNATAGPTVGRAVEFDWSQAGSRVTVTPSEPLDLSGSGALQARIAVDAGGDPVSFEVEVADASGRTAVAGTWGPVEAMPGGPVLPSRRWAQLLAVPLGPIADAVDLSRIASVQLRVDTAGGRIWLLDLTTGPA